MPARTISVHSAADVNKTWQAGDTLVWTNGSYTGKELTIKGTGTAASPIVLIAQTPGQVSFSTKSRLTFDGSYIEANGFVFTGTYTGTDHIVQFTSSSSHCRLTECSIDNFNPTDVTKDFKWVSLKGQYNRVDHCYFAGKTNMGTLLVVWLETGIVPCHHVDNCYFGARVPQYDSSGKELNGQEIIRIGDSSTSMQEAQCVVESNYFEDCDGEIEIISNKSCGNIYRYNTFYGCAGALTLRHGNGCTVDGNWFFGAGKSSSGGVRIIGEDHIVKNNFFKDLEGNNYRAAIWVTRGKPNSALNEYFQVKNAQIYSNTFVNCKEAFSIHYHSSSECTLLAINTNIDNNIVYNDASHTSVKIVNMATSGGSITWAGNIYNAGKFSSFSPTSAQWTKNSSMQRPQPAADYPTADTSGPMWRRSSQPSALYEPVYNQNVNKILHNGQLIIISTDPHSGQQTKYNTIGQKL